MASTEKLPSGRHRGLYHDANGKKQRVPGTFGRKSDALDAAVDAQAKAHRRATVNTGSASAKMTFRDLWAMVEPLRQFENSDTAGTEKSIVNRYLMPKWADEPINRITNRAVQRWVDTDLKVCKGRSGAYVQRIYSVFSATINWAVKEEVLTASPCVGITLPKRTKRSKPHVTTEQAGQLGEHLRQDYQDAIDFGLECGLRPGELCGLHANRVDLKNGWLEVAEVFVARRRVIRPFPKDNDARTVPLTPKAVAILRRRLKGRDLTGGCGLPHTDKEACTSALVFLSDRENVMRPDTVGLAMRTAAKAAEQPPKSYYAVRRGFATRAAHGGMDAFSLADVLGHADVRVTRGYVQQSPAARAELIGALGDRPALAVVADNGAEESGERGTAWDERGTNPENQPLPKAPKRRARHAR